MQREKRFGAVPFHAVRINNSTPVEDLGMHATSHYGDILSPYARSLMCVVGFDYARIQDLLDVSPPFGIPDIPGMRMMRVISNGPSKTIREIGDLWMKDGKPLVVVFPDIIIRDDAAHKACVEAWIATKSLTVDDYIRRCYSVECLPDMDAGNTTNFVRHVLCLDEEFLGCIRDFWWVLACELGVHYEYCQDLATSSCPARNLLFDYAVYEGATVNDLFRALNRCCYNKFLGQFCSTDHCRRVAQVLFIDLLAKYFSLRRKQHIC